jgi:hypothetical protein
MRVAIILAAALALAVAAPAQEGDGIFPFNKMVTVTIFLGSLRMANRGDDSYVSEKTIDALDCLHYPFYVPYCRSYHGRRW